jgi:Fibronectin type III domain
MSNLFGGGRKVRRGLVALGVVVAGFLMAIAVVASAQTDTGTTSGATDTGGTGTTTGGGGGTVIDLGEGWRVVFVAGVVGVFAALWFTLMWRDRTQTNARINKVLDAFIEEKKERGPERPWTLQEMRTVINAAATKGATGLTRTTIALGLLTLVGVALAALLVGNGANASDLLKTVVTALTTALTTVLGFYFGSKATGEGVAQGADPSGGAAGPAKGTPPDAPTITGVKPGSRQVEVTFTAPAKTGDSAITGYTVTSDPGAKTASGKGSPIIVGGLEPSTTYTFTVHATSASGVSPESARSDKAETLADPIA